MDAIKVMAVYMDWPMSSYSLEILKAHRDHFDCTSPKSNIYNLYKTRSLRSRDHRLCIVNGTKSCMPRHSGHVLH
jgi:hypothetical protein